MKKSDDYSESYEGLFRWRNYERSDSDELLVPRVENSTSRWESLWKQSPVGFSKSQFSKSMFRDVPGTVPESVRACGCKRKSAELDRAPEIRDSVLLNSWDSFLVTWHSISSKTCVMFSPVILNKYICFHCAYLNMWTLRVNYMKIPKLWVNIEFNVYQVSV